MSKKRRSKLRKLAKTLGAGIALAGLGKAFSNRNARGSTNADAIKAMTSDAAYMDNTMPSMLTGNMGKDRFSTRRRDSILASPEINRITDYYGENLKKGGRVGCGVAKRGFGKAMKKGGKK